MKSVVICLLFAPIVYLALRQKKWYLYLLCAFIGVLPEQFSIKLFEGFPLLSASRILIIIALGFWAWDKWKTKVFHFPKSLLVFFGINLIISLINLQYGATEIKRIFLLIFEWVLLAIMLMDMIHDREEFHRCIDFAIMGCAALAVIGIVQTVFHYDLSSALHLTKTVTSVQLASRMGLMRAFGTYNAISYGCYCAFMAFLILYRLYATKSIWHSGAFALNFIALICTFTRSAWLCFAGIAFVALLLFGGKLIRRLLPSIALTLALISVLCCAQPKLFNAFVETGKSSINTILGIVPDSVVSLFFPDGTQNSDQPDATSPTVPDNSTPGFVLDEDFGMNASDPAYSRTAQWTAVKYMAKEGVLLFGYGYNALLRGRIHFFFDRWAAKWEPTDFLDVGLVALIAESGLFGAIAHLCLLACLFICALRRKIHLKERKLDFYWLTILMIPLYLLLNYLAAFLYAQVVWLFIGLFYAYKKLEGCEQNNLPAEQA